jgi:hypothetical protein
MARLRALTTREARLPQRSGTSAGMALAWPAATARARPTSGRDADRDDVGNE